jgi:hypothetical protein
MVKGEATMSEHAFDDKDMTGYYLPRDSQRLLTKIKDHIQILAQLAQPRDAGDAQATGPKLLMREFTTCLSPLAEQLELVLKARSRPAHCEATDEAQGLGNTVQQGAVEAEAEDEELEEDAPELAGTGHDQPCEDAFICGVTLDQIDQLNRLVERIKAYGDAVSANGAADFAPGTLSILGHTIFDRAVELDALVSEIYTQTLEQDPRQPFSVRETPPAYCAQPASWLDPETHSSAISRSPAWTAHLRPDAVLLH